MSGYAMAPMRSISGSNPPVGGDRPIDLVHLSRQTLGDRELEIELLTLFERQAAQAVQRFQTHEACAERKWRRDLAHTLKGSARAIGATHVAAAAQRYEDLLMGAASEPALKHSLSDLVAAIEEARAAALEFIA